MDFISFDESVEFFECGYSCDNGAVVVLSGEKIFITDARYELESKTAIGGRAEVIITADSLINVVVKELARRGVKKITADSNKLSMADFLALEKAGIKVEGAPNFHQKLRIVKSDLEVKKIKESQRLNKLAFENFARFLGENFENLGAKTELELNHLAKDFLTDFGKYELSFAPILAFDENAAKPHALPTAEALDSKKLLLFDAGIKFERYCSDMTRSMALGASINCNKAQSFSNPHFQKIYDVVRRAQEFAIENIRPGMSGREVDALARGVIEKAGFGAYFTHSTGHGVGLDIHELPRISPKSDEVITENMVFSIEPGIYLPNDLGIRIEDLVLVTPTGAEVL